VPMFSELSVSSLRELKSSVCSYQLSVGSWHCAEWAGEELETTLKNQDSKLLFFCKIFNNSLSKTF
jgi:hypothetical protein